MKDVIKDSSKIKYLIVSLTSQEENDEDDALGVVAQKQRHLGDYIKKEMDSQSKVIQNMRTRIDNIANSLY